MSQRLLHKVQVLRKRISLNPNLDFSQITQTSQRGVGESSRMLRNEFGSLVVLAASKGGREKLLYLPPQTSHWELASKNWNIRFWKPEHPEFEN
jgi:hypothetical protein